MNTSDFFISFWFVFAIAFLTIVWSFFFSPFFKIAEIKLSKNDIVTSDDIHKFIIDSAPLNLGENLLIVSKDQIKSHLAAAFPAITGINIKKELFHSLIVDFEKRIQVGIWCHSKQEPPASPELQRGEQADQCYYFDKEGIIFKEAPQTEGALILKIKDFGKDEVFLGEQILNNEQLVFIIKFNNEIMKNNQFKIIEFEIKPSTNLDLGAKTDRGFSIYINQDQDPVLEANNLFTILNEVIKGNSSNLDYVDLRIPSRIFYKLK